VLLGTLGGIRQPGPVEGERALGGDVLQEVAVAFAQRPLGAEADGHGAEGASLGVLQRHDDERRIEGDAQAVEVGVAGPAVGLGRHHHRLAGADHLGGRERRREGDAAEPLPERPGWQAGRAGHHQFVAHLGQDVDRGGVPAQQLDALVEHGSHDVGGPAQAVDPLDQTGHASGGTQRPGGVDEDARGRHAVGASVRRVVAADGAVLAAGDQPSDGGDGGDRVHPQHGPPLAVDQPHRLLAGPAAAEHRPEAVGGPGAVIGVEHLEPAVAAQPGDARPGTRRIVDLGGDTPAVAVPPQRQRERATGVRPAVGVDAYR
jgi:hypothetical protein